MPRDIDTSSQAALDLGAIVERTLIAFDFGEEGLFGFHTGFGEIVVDGLTYVGSGSLLSISEMRQSSSTASQSLVISLRAIPESELSPDVLVTIEDYSYHFKPVLISTMYLDPQTYVLLSVEPEFRGFVDRMTHREVAGGECVLECYVESRFRDLSRQDYRVRSDLDQRRIAASDDGLRHVVTVATEKITFGRSTQPPFVPKKKSLLTRLFG